MFNVRMAPTAEGGPSRAVCPVCEWQGDRHYCPGLRRGTELFGL